MDYQSDEIRKQVMDRYRDVALEQTDCCGPSQSCCGDGEAEATSKALGYSDGELASVPKGANMGLGCGNPQTIASLKRGDTVLDLGSGAGFDAFLSSRSVEESGRVIGVDMTPEMIQKARRIAEENGYDNVEFRLGEIEHLPVSNDSVDVVISNCVINLSPDKPRVFKETYRVLKPGGRIAISDVVAMRELPEEVRQDQKLYTGCMGGASPVDELTAMIENAGFVDVSITPSEESKSFLKDWSPGSRIEDYILSATITAKKPQR